MFRNCLKHDFDPLSKEFIRNLSIPKQTVQPFDFGGQAIMNEKYMLTIKLIGKTLDISSTSCYNLINLIE